jgi:Protein of unknown function (DUF3363)
MALFVRGPRKAPLIGKVVGVGMVDEITDRTCVVIAAVDGRVHYAELGRLRPSDVPARGTLAALGGEAVPGKPSAAPKLQLLSPMELDRQPTKAQPGSIKPCSPSGGPILTSRALAPSCEAPSQPDLRWLEKRQLVAPTDGAEELFPKLDMMRALRQFETQRLVASLSRELRAAYVAHEVGTRINGIYERLIVTSTGRLALIRREHTFTLAPRKPALELLRGRAVTGVVGPTRVTWTIDRARPVRTVAGQC